VTGVAGFCAMCGAARPIGAAFCPSCGASYQAEVLGPVATASPRLAASPTAIVAIIAGALAAVGAFLPWATLSSGLMSVSKAGIEADGMLTAAAGGVAALYGLLRVIQPAIVKPAVRVLLLIVAAFIGWVGFMDLGNVTEIIGGLGENVYGSVGIRLYLTLFAAVLMAIAAALPNRTA